MDTTYVNDGYMAQPEAKRVVAKRDDERKQRAFDIISTMRAANKSETEVLKALQEQLKISYANSYYYTRRVFTK
jgi:hypothetical protein